MAHEVQHDTVSTPSPHCVETVPTYRDRDCYWYGDGDFHFYPYKNFYLYLYRRGETEGGTHFVFHVT